MARGQRMATQVECEPTGCRDVCRAAGWAWEPCCMVSMAKCTADAAPLTDHHHERKQCHASHDYPRDSPGRQDHARRGSWSACNRRRRRRAVAVERQGVWCVLMHTCHVSSPLATQAAGMPSEFRTTAAAPVPEHNGGSQVWMLGIRPKRNVCGDGLQAVQRGKCPMYRRRCTPPHPRHSI